MTRRIRLAALALLAVVVAVLSSCSSSAGGEKSGLSSSKGDGTYQGLALDPPQPRPSFTLIDTEGKPFSFAERTAGRNTLVFFGYTNCPDICPTTMANIHQAMSTLPVAVQKDFYIVFVSTDVKHDTGPMIKEWLSNFTVGLPATFVGLRGSQAAIDGAQIASHIPVAEDGGTTHSTQVLWFGTDDYARVTWLQTEDEAAQMTHDLALAAR